MPVVFQRRLRQILAALTGGVLVTSFLPGPAAIAQPSTTLELVSRSTTGEIADSYSENPAISADGRYVAFSSPATNLVPGDTNELSDVFVRDRQTGSTERVSVSSAGEQADDSSYLAQVSDDGRYVAFLSMARNLDGFDPETCVEENDGDLEEYNCQDLFVRDRETGQTLRVNRGPSGEWANGDVGEYAMSADGTRFVFGSRANNLVVGDTGEAWDWDGGDVFVHDLASGSTTRASVSTTGVEGDGQSLQPDISGDGRSVVFSSAASNLIDGQVKTCCDIYLRDLLTGETSTLGMAGENYSAAIDADGSRVAFSSYAQLLPTDSNPSYNTYVYDVPTGELQLAEISIDGQTVGRGASHISISADGEVVAFAADVDLGAPAPGVYLRNLPLGVTEYVAPGQWPGINADGTIVTFASRDATLVAGDTNNTDDVFVRAASADADTDADGDGVHDNIDAGDGAFDDGAGTAGSIVDTAGHDVSVVPDPDGVRIAVAGSGSVKAVFEVCGFTLRLAPGSEVVVSCGSITIGVISGAAEVVLDDGLGAISVPEGVTALVDQDPGGSYSVVHLAGGDPIGITIDGVTSSLAPGASLDLEDWTIEVWLGAADDIRAIVDANPGPSADKLDDALAKVETALAELAKTPPDQVAALGNVEGAVGELEAAVKDGVLDTAAGDDLMDRMTGAALTLANEAIAEAEARGADPRKITQAKREQDRGDAARLAGRYKDAVARYRDALSKAEGA